MIWFGSFERLGLRFNYYLTKTCFFRYVFVHSSFILMILSHTRYYYSKKYDVNFVLYVKFYFHTDDIIYFCSV